MHSSFNVLLFHNSIISCKSSFMTYLMGSNTSKCTISSLNVGLLSCLREMAVVSHWWRSAAPSLNLIKQIQAVKHTESWVYIRMQHIQINNWIEFSAFVYNFKTAHQTNWKHCSKFNSTQPKQKRNSFEFVTNTTNCTYSITHNSSTWTYNITHTSHTHIPAHTP